MEGVGEDGTKGDKLCVGEVESVLWNDPEELRRRIHLVARTYSNEPDEQPAPAAEPAGS